MATFLTEHQIADFRNKSKEELISFIDSLLFFMMIQGAVDNLKKENPERYEQMCKEIEERTKDIKMKYAIKKE